MIEYVGLVVSLIASAYGLSEEEFRERALHVCLGAISGVILARYAGVSAPDKVRFVDAVYMEAVGAPSSSIWKRRIEVAE
jgi:formylmethanofuran dehydrogenase subunit E-like metal-binding protein